MANTRQTTLDNEIATCDDDIQDLLIRVAELMSTRRDLLHKRNTHSPISELPNELLGAILAEARESYWASLNHDGPDYRDIWLYTLCGVCSRWRMVARNTPRYWRFITLSLNTERVFEALQRSGSSPLCVQGHITGYELRIPEFQAAFEWLTSQLERVQSWNLVLPCDGHLDHAFNSSAPLLETLCLRFPDAVKSVDIPPTMSALRTLKLFNLIPKAKLPHLPCLRQLSISVMQSTELTEIESAWLINSLHNTPMVEDVVLDFFLFKANVGDITAMTPTSLPHLSYFSLWCYYPSFPINFFDFINFPESAIIEFVCNGGEPSATDLVGLRDFLVRFSSQRDTSITQVSISGDHQFELAVLTDQSASEPHITISLPTGLANNNIEDYMNVYAALPLSTVPGLVLDSLSRCFPPGYNFLQPFHAVEVVKISHCTQHMFDDLKPIAGVIPLPNLRMIIMSECDARDDIFLELVKFLENRLPHSEADGLEKICIEGCDIADKEVIERLQAFCEVEWDGLTSATDAWEASSSDESEGSDWSDTSEGSLASGDAYTRATTSLYTREYNICDVNLEPR